MAWPPSRADRAAFARPPGPSLKNIMVSIIGPNYRAQVRACTSPALSNGQAGSLLLYPHPQRWFLSR